MTARRCLFIGTADVEFVTPKVPATHAVAGQLELVFRPRRTNSRADLVNLNHVAHNSHGQTTIGVVDQILRPSSQEPTWLLLETLRRPLSLDSRR